LLLSLHLTSKGCRTRKRAVALGVICQMRVMRKLGIFILMLSVLYGVYRYDKSGLNQLNEKLKIDTLPGKSELVEFYFSGLGMDHHYLWKITGDKLSNFEIITRIKAEKLKPTASSGCLSLLKNQAPDWWPVEDIEDVLWGNDKSKHQLYVKKLQDYGKVCIIDSLVDNTLYIQWFDI
jgi:hypothetical protein